MDNDIKDLKRRAGITEAEETYSTAAYEDLDFILKDETRFLGNLSRVLARALSPVHRKEVLTVLNNRLKSLTDFHQEKVGKPQQEQQQDQQQQKFKKAEQEKAGGPRRSYGSA
jgi:hypothetical protein